VLVTPVARPGAPTLVAVTAEHHPQPRLHRRQRRQLADHRLPVPAERGAWQSTAATTSPLVISGLTNGTSYTVILRAVSAVGTGALSTSLSGTPFTFPDAPSGVAADGRGSSAQVSWVAPANNGSAITSYTATAFSAATPAPRSAPAPPPP